jgi:hypothetical protein
MQDMCTVFSFTINNSQLAPLTVRKQLAPLTVRKQFKRHKTSMKKIRQKPLRLNTLVPRAVNQSDYSYLRPIESRYYLG